MNSERWTEIHYILYTCYQYLVGLIFAESV